MRRVTPVMLAALFLVLAGTAAGDATQVTDGRGLQLVWFSAEQPCTADQLAAFPEAMAHWNVEGPNNYIYEEMVFDDTPIITVTNHAEWMQDARFLAMLTHGNAEGWYAAEYYATFEAALDALAAYRLGGLDDSMVLLGQTSYDTYVLIVSKNFVEWNAGSLAPRAIADLGWCHSVTAADAFFTIGATSVMAYEDTIDRARNCRNHGTRWKRLGCKEGAEETYNSNVLGANQVPGGVLLSATDSYADSANSINLNCDCDNWAARILDWGVDRSGRVLFLTDYERHSGAFHVYGFRGAERETLAVLEPKGDESGRIFVYETRVAPGYDEYQIAEIDGDRGRRTATDWKRPGNFPSRLDEMAALAGTQLGEIVPAGPPPYGERRGPALLRAEAWGDAVVYAPDTAMAAPLLGQLSSQGMETVLCVGDGTREDVAGAYEYTYEANVARNGELGEERYPVWPGPELYLIGRASDGAVLTNLWEDDAWENCNQPQCRGDFDYTDVDGDGRPNGPVARLFADTPEEVARMVFFSDRYNAEGGAGAPSLLCAGDLDYAGDDDVPFPGPDLWLDKVEIALAAMGAPGGAIRFRRSDYETSYDATTAGVALVNEGVGQIWAMGPLSGYKRIPSSVMYGTSYDAAALTTDQAYLLIAPGCEVAADWGLGAFYGLLLQKLMTNEPGRSGCAGAVAHWSGGWGSKHDTWANYVLKKFVDARPGDSMPVVLWRAFIRCTDECPWMADYCRSAVYVGARTLVRGNEVSVGGAAPTTPSGLELQVRPSFAGRNPCTIRYRLPAPGAATVRIFDLRGRPVRSLGGGAASAGMMETRWDGRDDQGRRVASGVYFARVESAEGALTKKITVIR